MKAIYPGSFDPLTKGHIDIIKRISNKFEYVIVAVLDNINKNTLFTKKERCMMIEEEFKYCKNIEVKSFDGLLVEFAKKNNANVVIRGLRAISDYEYELQIAHVNNALDKDLETMFLVAKSEYSFISSSIVKELAKYKKDISALVPMNVSKLLKEKYKEA